MSSSFSPRFPTKNSAAAAKQNEQAVNPSLPCHALKQSNANTSLEATIKMAERAGDNLGMGTPSNKAHNFYHDLPIISSRSAGFGTTVTTLVFTLISDKSNHDVFCG